MGTIICKSCESTVGYYEDEKVTVIYATDHKCKSCDTTTKENK